MIKIAKFTHNFIDYELQSDGRFFKWRTHRNRSPLRVEMKGAMNQYGYLSFSYGGKYGTRELASRMVARYFCPNPLNKSEVNHIDGNKLNNDYSNLEWVTHSENGIHAYRILGRPTNGGKNLRGRGIIFHKEQRKWEARVKRFSKTYWLGSFKTEAEALLAAKKFKEEFDGKSA